MHIRSLVLTTDHDARELHVEGLTAGLTAFYGPRDGGRAALCDFLREALLRGEATSQRGSMELAHEGQTRETISNAADSRRHRDSAAAWRTIPAATRRRFCINLLETGTLTANIADWLAATPPSGTPKTPTDEPLAGLLRRRDQLAERLDDLLAGDRSRLGPLEWEPRQIDARIEACRQELRRCDDEHARAAAELASLERAPARAARGGEASRSQLSDLARGDLDALDQQIVLWRQALNAGDRREEAIREHRNEHFARHERIAAELESLTHCQRAVRTHVDQLLRLRRKFAAEVAPVVAPSPFAGEPARPSDRRRRELMERLERLEQARRALRGEIEDYRAQHSEQSTPHRGDALAEVRASLREIEASIHAALHASQGGIAEAGREWHAASSYLRAMSGGRLTAIVTPPGRAARVHDAHGSDVPLSSLSPAHLRLTALAAFLAHAEARGEPASNVPLVVEEPFAGQDEETAERICEVLCRYAAAGRQTLVFTDHGVAARHLRAAGADVREQRRQAAPSQAEQRERATAAETGPRTLRIHPRTKPQRRAKAA